MGLKSLVLADTAVELRLVLGILHSSLSSGGRVSALESPFGHDGVEFRCVVCFPLVQTPAAASVCTEALSLL